MKILLAEDDENKRSQIESFIAAEFAEEELTAVRSYHSAIVSLMEPTGYDLLLLDMSMPTYDIDASEPGGRPQQLAGLEILKRLDKRKIRVPVIVVTQFDVFGQGSEALTRNQLDEILRRDHQVNYVGTVYYNAANDLWKGQLKQLTQHVQQGIGT